MTQSIQTISPLRQRMIDEMKLRRLKPRTQAGYLRAVKNLSLFLGHSPHTATAEDLRRFQLHLVERGTSNITINATLTALRFFFCHTLDRAEVTAKLASVPTPRKLPLILSIEEVTRLIEAADNAKYKAALSVAYGAGLRTSEVLHLKVSDIDSARMLLHVDQGKGDKDRIAMLSPVLLALLRDWWRIGQAQHLMLKGGWLFPGQDPTNPLSIRQLHRVCVAATQAAGIHKAVSMHTLRHYADNLIIPSYSSSVI